MVTILVNTKNAEEVIAKVSPIIASEISVSFRCVDYNALNVERFKRTFSTVNNKTISKYLFGLKRDGDLSGSFIEDILPIDNSKEFVYFIFGEFAESEWVSLKQNNAILVGGGGLEYCYESCDLDIPVFAVDSLGYQLASVANFLIQSSIKYNIPSGRVLLIRELEKAAKI